MKLKKSSSPPDAKIVSMPLSKLTEYDSEFTQTFFTELLKVVPQCGKENPTNFVLNTNLTINNANKPLLMQKLNLFLQLIGRQCHYIHLVKNS